MYDHFSCAAISMYLSNKLVHKTNKYNIEIINYKFNSKLNLKLMEIKTEGILTLIRNNIFV